MATPRYINTPVSDGGATQKSIEDSFNRFLAQRQQTQNFRQQLMAEERAAAQRALADSKAEARRMDDRRYAEEREAERREYALGLRDEEREFQKGIREEERQREDEKEESRRAYQKDISDLARAEAAKAAYVRAGGSVDDLIKKMGLDSLSVDGLRDKDGNIDDNILRINEETFKIVKAEAEGQKIDQVKSALVEMGVEDSQMLRGEGESDEEYRNSLLRLVHSTKIARGEEAVERQFNLKQKQLALTLMSEEDYQKILNEGGTFGVNKRIEEISGQKVKDNALAADRFTEFAQYKESARRLGLQISEEDFEKVGKNLTDDKIYSDFRNKVLEGRVASERAVYEKRKAETFIEIEGLIDSQKEAESKNILSVYKMLQDPDMRNDALKRGLITQEMADSIANDPNPAARVKSVVDTAVGISGKTDALMTWANATRTAKINEEGEGADTTVFRYSQLKRLTDLDNKLSTLDADFNKFLNAPVPGDILRTPYSQFDGMGVSLSPSQGGASVPVQPLGTGQTPAAGGGQGPTTISLPGLPPNPDDANPEETVNPEGLTDLGYTEAQVKAFTEASELIGEDKDWWKGLQDPDVYLRKRLATMRLQLETDAYNTGVKEEGGEKIAPFGADRTPITQWLGGGLKNLGGWALDKTGLSDGGGVNPSRRSKFYYNKDYDTKALRRDVEFEPEDRERLLKQYNEAKEAIGNIDRILPDFSAARPNQGSSAPAMPQGGGSSMPVTPRPKVGGGVDGENLPYLKPILSSGEGLSIEDIDRRMEELSRRMSRDQPIEVLKGLSEQMDNLARIKENRKNLQITPNPPRLQSGESLPELYSVESERAQYEADNELPGLPVDYGLLASVDGGSYSTSGDPLQPVPFSEEANQRAEYLRDNYLPAVDSPAVREKMGEVVYQTLGTEMPPASDLRPPAYPPEPLPPVVEYQAPLTDGEKLQQRMDAEQQQQEELRAAYDTAIQEASRIEGGSLPMAPGVPAPSRPQVSSQNIPQVPVMPPDYPVSGPSLPAPAVPKPVNPNVAPTGGTGRRGAGVMAPAVPKPVNPNVALPAAPSVPKPMYPYAAPTGPLVTDQLPSPAGPPDDTDMLQEAGVLLDGMSPRDIEYAIRVRMLDLTSKGTQAEFETYYPVLQELLEKAMNNTLVIDPDKIPTVEPMPEPVVPALPGLPR